MTTIYGLVPLEFRLAAVSFRFFKMAAAIVLIWGLSTIWGGGRAPSDAGPVAGHMHNIVRLKAETVITIMTKICGKTMLGKRSDI